MEEVREGLVALGHCEAEFGDFSGWYARVGFSYEASLNAAYPISRLVEPTLRATGRRRPRVPVPTAVWQPHRRPLKRAYCFAQLSMR